MEQEEITKIYETLAPMAGDYANAQAEQIGQAQRSIGPMAANVMGQSQTAGLGNYTYNRLMRPQVDVMRDEIRVQGYANQLNRLLSDALNNARNNYNRKSGSGGSNSSDSTYGQDLTFEDEVTDEQQQTKLYLTPSEAYNLSSGEGKLYTKSELEGLSGRPMTDQSYNDYRSMIEKYSSTLKSGVDNTWVKNKDTMNRDDLTTEDIRKMWSK